MRHKHQALAFERCRSGESEEAKSAFLLTARSTLGVADQFARCAAVVGQEKRWLAFLVHRAAGAIPTQNQGRLEERGCNGAAPDFRWRTPKQKRNEPACSKDRCAGLSRPQGS